MRMLVQSSRRFEREADEFAFQWMSKNHVDPRQLGELLRRLSTQQGGDEGGYLSSHPDLRDRLRTMHLDSQTDRARE